MDVSNHVIKLQGKAELPEAVDIGHNYRVAVEGSITKKEDSDNENGTLTRLYTFKPIRIEVLTPTGETIRAKDTRSNSQLMRSLIYKKWLDAASNLDFDEYYARVMASAMANIEKIIDWSSAS